jgi:hypothetical protein
VALSYLRNILANPFYIGRVRWHGREYPAKHEAIINDVLFERVQAVLKERQSNPGDKGTHKFLLRGVAFCSECGGRMTAEQHGRWSYYRCSKNTIDRALCTAPFSNVQRAHDSMSRLLRSLRLTAEFRQAVIAATTAHANGRVHAARRSLHSLRAQRRALTRRSTG